MDKNPLLEQPTGKPSMAPGFHSLTPKPTVFLFQLTLRPPFPLSLFIPIQSSPSSTETSCQISHLCLPPFTTQQHPVQTNRLPKPYLFSLSILSPPSPVSPALFFWVFSPRMGGYPDRKHAFSCGFWNTQIEKYCFFLPGFLRVCWSFDQSCDFECEWGLRRRCPIGKIIKIFTNRRWRRIRLPRPGSAGDVIGRCRRCRSYTRRARLCFPCAAPGLFPPPMISKSYALFWVRISAIAWFTSF